jgi:hypothetical protein
MKLAGSAFLVGFSHLQFGNVLWPHSFPDHYLALTYNEKYLCLPSCYALNLKHLPSASIIRANSSSSLRKAFISVFVHIYTPSSRCIEEPSSPALSPPVLFGYYATLVPEWHVGSKGTKKDGGGDQRNRRDGDKIMSGDGESFSNSSSASVI